jgi:hypothetical protein
MIGEQQLPFITEIRRRRFESFGKELKKGVRVVAGEHIVRSVPVSVTPGEIPITETSSRTLLSSRTVSSNE